MAGLLLAAIFSGARAVTGAKSVERGARSRRSNIVTLARSLFTDYVFAFELTSALLVIAVVGAVVLARRDRAIRRRGHPVTPTSTWYLALGAVLFTIGMIGILVRRNPLVMFMCVELMLNAANLTFVTFSQKLNDVAGQTVVFFVLVVAAAEVVVGLGIIVAILRRQPSATADDISLMRG